MDTDNETRTLLIDLLREAARLEHCLLNAYLVAACSIPSTPAEFARFGGKDNRRRAIQFERARGWKQSILLVAHEEMLHLHYVQCMLRALGESPEFSLPERTDGGHWLFPAWKARVGKKPADGGKGVEVPLAPLSLEVVRKFVLYESTDALQDADPFGERATELFRRLYEFETDLRLEGMLLKVDDDETRAALKEKLHRLYTELTPIPAEEVEDKIRAEFVAHGLPAVEEIKFQSIADLYLHGILPLYQQAFDRGWVRYSNRDLSNELADPNVAGEGFLPIGPVYRSQNFKKLAEQNQGPLKNFKDIRRVIDEIVAEGEGSSRFEARANAVLQKLREAGGARAYLKARQAKPTAPQWIDEAEVLRNSHLYRFAMIMMGIQEEARLAAQVGQAFDPAREPVKTEDSVRLGQFAEDLPERFNACCLALHAWLARIYEIPQWKEDRPERAAIEMLASWPLMSTAVRPFLELTSFFPDVWGRLFRLDPDGLGVLPLHARELHALMKSPNRSEAINDRIDYLVVRVFAAVAEWARGQRDVIEADVPEPARRIILARLDALADLGEIQKQFPFHVHGGYSGTLPDLGFQQAEAETSGRFQEDAASLSPLFDRALVLRLRFAGWGQVQLATDPDPPTDESGCTGTHMLHAADGDRVLNRALVWQGGENGPDIPRAPRTELPAVGVNGVDAALCVATAASAGYAPLQVISSVGAVQTSGLQQYLKIDGLAPLLTLAPVDVVGKGGTIRLNLAPKGGRPPALQGMNHIVWKDGEPIDPFVLTIHMEEAGGKLGLVCSREIYNEGLNLLEMSPLQRVLSARGPCGFDSVKNTPAWVLRALPAADRDRLLAPAFPQSYLDQRARALAGYLAETLKGCGDEPSQRAVDDAVSAAERLHLVTLPRSTTVAWLRYLLHYGHTVSGLQASGPSVAGFLAAFERKLGLKLSLPEPAPRDKSNSRWLIRYTMGAMDTDALCDLVYGEVYVPVVAAPADGDLTLTREWSFPGAVAGAIREFACRFAAPFWAEYTVTGKSRTTALRPDVTLTETLTEEEADRYSYRLTGLPGVASFTSTLALHEAGARVALRWRAQVTAGTATALVDVVSYFTATADAMADRLKAYFEPDERT